MPVQPMPLQKRRLLFNDANFLFELKYDGFLALAVAERRPELVSRNDLLFHRRPPCFTASDPMVCARIVERHRWCQTRREEA